MEFRDLFVPAPFEVNGGSIKIIVSNNFRLVKVYTLSGTYPNLQPFPFTGTSISCQSLDSIKIGKNGNIDCSVSIPFTGLLKPITGIAINFLNSGNNQLTTLYSECEAYLMDSTIPVVPSGKQLLCSRNDASTSSPVIFVPNISFDVDYTVIIKFKARVKALNYLTVDVSLMHPNENNVYYTYLKEANLDLSFTNLINSLGNLLISLSLTF